MNVTVFRVEDENGHGPYHNKGARSLFDMWADGRHNADNGRPLPKYDIENWNELYSEGVIEDYCYGFLYLEQLHSWFSKSELTKLKCLGYNVQQHEVDEQHILLGDYQIAFIK